MHGTWLHMLQALMQCLCINIGFLLHSPTLAHQSQFLWWLTHPVGGCNGFPSQVSQDFLKKSKKDGTKERRTDNSCVQLLYVRPYPWTIAMFSHWLLRNLQFVCIQYALVRHSPSFAHPAQCSLVSTHPQKLQVFLQTFNVSALSSP